LLNYFCLLGKLCMVSLHTAFQYDLGFRMLDCEIEIEMVGLR